MKYSSKRTSIVKYLAFSMVCFLFSCKNDQAATDSKNTSISTAQENQQSNESLTSSSSDSGDNTGAKNIGFAWVENLNIRDKPNTKSKIISRVQKNDPLEFTGEQSEKNETIVLRGVAYDEPWYKIITRDKKEGWIFGGAVRFQDEDKGNRIIDENNLDFPYFGRFKLKEWTKTGVKDESRGDAAIITTIYKKGNRILEISKVDIGDYGYERLYKLRDTNNKLLREREFKFLTDVDFRELVEIVRNYATSPKKQYTRSQTLKKHYSQLNAIPMMVNGIWTESDIK